MLCFTAWRKKSTTASFRFRFKRLTQNQIQYEIRDNGYGMEDQQLEELLNSLRQFDKRVANRRQDAKLWNWVIQYLSENQVVLR